MSERSNGDAVASASGSAAPMRVFVAGATGTLGRPLVRALAGAGHDVVGLTRSVLRAGIVEADGGRAVVADALDRDGLAAAVREARPAVVVHLLTALPPGGPRTAADLEATNRLRIEGTANVIAAAEAAGVRRVVAESFCYVYGLGQPWRAGQPLLGEDTPFVDDDFARRAGLQPLFDALRSLEAQMASARSRGTIETVVLRYGQLYGAGVPSMDGLWDELRRRRLPLPKGGEGLAALIHVDDAVAATVAALDRGPGGGVYNVVDDTPFGFASMIRLAAEVWGLPRPLRVPWWLVRRAAPTAAAGIAAWLPLSNARARAELGWRPVYASVGEGLRADEDAAG